MKFKNNNYVSLKREEELRKAVEGILRKIMTEVKGKKIISLIHDEVIVEK
jgi:hypothetical protein